MDISSSNIIATGSQDTTPTPTTTMPDKSEVEKATEALKKENEQLQEAIKQKEKEEAQLLKMIRNAT